jgi:hypothetical protein
LATINNDSAQVYQLIKWKLWDNSNYTYW